MPIRFFLSALVAAAFVAAAFVLAGCQAGSADFSDIEDRPLEDQVAYIVGFNNGEGLRSQISADTTLEIDYDLLADAFRAGVSGDSSAFSEEQMQEVMTAFQDTMILRSPEVQAATAAADSFLTANAERDSVSVTASGLQYQVLEPGDGPSPALGDRVTVDYEGTLLDGTVFDSSYRRGEPAQFVVGQVIEGWNEALGLMEAGARWRLFIPPDLAYGLRPDPRSGIPPNAMLIFDVELIDVTPAEDAAPAQ